LSDDILRHIAHTTLCLSPSPLLQYQLGGKFLRTEKLACTKSATTGPSFNFAAAVESPLPTLREILPVAESFFGANRSGYGILVEGGRGEPLESELVQNGYRVFEDEPAFVRPDLKNLEIPQHPLRIRTVETIAEFQNYCRLVTEVFQAPPELAEELMPVRCLEEPDIRLFLGEYQGEPICAVCYLKTGPVAHLAGTATRESLRGRGFGAALVLVALDDARRRGCIAAALRSGPLSVPLYQRLGFEYVCQHRTYAIDETRSQK
jgi:GNAT superfamily N-acetyltransferase